MELVINILLYIVYLVGAFYIGITLLSAPVLLAVWIRDIYNDIRRDLNA